MSQEAGSVSVNQPNTPAPIPIKPIFFIRVMAGGKVAWKWDTINSQVPRDSLAGVSTRLM